MQLSSVLGHASVSGLDKSKLDPDDSEQMLDLGADLSFQSFKLIGDSVFGRVSRNLSFAGSHGNVSRAPGLRASLCPTVTRISERCTSSKYRKFRVVVLSGFEPLSKEKAANLRMAAIT
jgi:hypothetical protein